ncbi:MAG: hypothetical protein KGJ11_09900, partial [Candidatus Omnitrophica bacterium]|nr:hypothetical protein [Candidatus Omnitrophota bacterium]
EFEKLGCRMLPSVTNFVFVKLAAGIDAAKLVKDLEARNVWIKGPFKGAPVDGLIRITVGPAAQMKDFMHHVREVLSIRER